MRHNPGTTTNERDPAMRLSLLSSSAVTRAALALAIVLPAAACSGVDYRDSNAAVDANPLCASAPSQPGEPVSTDCERVREATWSSEGSESEQPLDFSGKRGD